MTGRIVTGRVAGLVVIAFAAAFALAAVTEREAAEAPGARREPLVQAGEGGSSFLRGAPWWQRKDRHTSEMSRIFQTRGYWWKHKEGPRAALKSPGWLVRGLRWIRQAAQRVLRWMSRLLSRLFRVTGVGRTIRRITEVTGLRPLAWVLFAIASAVLAVFVFRQVRHLIEVRRLSRRVEEPAPASTAPEALERLLPSEQMARKAREFAAQGDFKQAVRYLFLAALSRLEEAQYVTYVPHKTNRAYLKEVAGRGDLIQALRPFILVFDRTWYGEHRPVRGEFDVAHTYYRQVVRSTG